jgi:hypothetical protein
MSRNHRSIRNVVLALTLFAAFPAAASTAPVDISKEINITTAAATAVIASLQGDINAGKLKPEAVEPERLKNAFLEQFKKSTNSNLEDAQDPVIAKIRRDLKDAFLVVTEQYRKDMIKGGQDAFVPAFFRAELLSNFNSRSGGQYKAVVTTRNADLINRDSGADKFITDKAVLDYVTALLEKGEATPQSASVGARHVAYWPMKITEPCAVCHQRSGLVQNIGDFGGATVVIVEPQK